MKNKKTIISPCKKCGRINHHHLCPDITYEEWRIEMGHEPRK